MVNPELLSLSCGSPSTCIALGYGIVRSKSNFFDREIVDVLADGRWQPTTIPRPKGAGGGQMTSVSCVDRARCVAVGIDGKGQSFVATLTGSRWASIALPSPVRRAQLGLLTVSCRTVDTCVAAGVVSRGNDSAVFAETLHGSTWTSRQVTPMSARLYDQPVSSSCASANDCVLDVQRLSVTETYLDFVTLPEYTNLAVTLRGAGRTTSLVEPPTGGQSVDLQGLACPAAGRCVEVGDATYPNGDDLPVVATGG